MVVRKKILDPTGDSDKIDLVSNLARVRGAIKTLPPDEEGATMNENPTPPANESETKAKAKPKKKATAKKAVKKVTGNGATNQVTLGEIAKSIKMEPRRARRIMRNCDLKMIEVAGQRWSWTKGSNAHKKVVEVLKAADAD